VARPATAAGPSSTPTPAAVGVGVGVDVGAASRRGQVTDHLIAVGVLVAVTAIAYAPFISGGGFVADDWPNAEATRFGGPGGQGVLDYFWDVTSFRPVLALWVPFTHAVLGEHQTLHVLLSLGLAVLAAYLFFVALRTLGLRSAYALAPAVLVLPFPFSDSIRLWPTASMVSLSLALYFAGLVLALLALRPERPRIWLHLPSIGLYAASILTYEVTAPAVAASVVGYLATVRSRAAMVRGAADLVLAATLALTVSTGGPERAQDGSFAIDYIFDRVDLFGRQGLSVLGAGAFPEIFSGQAWVGALVFVAVLGSAVVAWRLPRDSALRQRLREISTLGVGGLWFTFLGYVGFLPAASFYVPTATGVGNRVNAAASYGMAMAIAGLAFTLAAFAVAALRRVPGRAATMVGIALVSLVTAGLIVNVRRDEKRYTRSHEIQDDVMDAIRATVRNPPQGAVVYALDYPVTTGANLPTFALSNDLRGAVRLAYDREDLVAMPVRPAVPLSCTSKGVQLGSQTVEPGFLTVGAYGRTYLVDVRTRRAARVTSAASCRRALPRFPAGPAVDPAAS
jgi:hypothetical protein